MIRTLKTIAKFAIVLIATTGVFSMIWEGFVTDTLYNCTDAVGFGYLHPGDWVHGHVAVVEPIVASRSMSEPDALKKGWSTDGLWALWISFFAASLVLAFLSARKTWMPPRNTEPASIREFVSR
jgi:hypothetical protein